MAHDVKLDQIDWSANFLFIFIFYFLFLAVQDNNSCPLSYTFRTNSGFGSWIVVAEGGALLTGKFGKEGQARRVYRVSRY
jgi:hypothetical protein